MKVMINNTVIDGWEIFTDKSNHKKVYIRHHVYGTIYNRNPAFNKLLADAVREPKPKSEMIATEATTSLKKSGWFGGVVVE